MYGYQWKETLSNRWMDPECPFFPQNRRQPSTERQKPKYYRKAYTELLGLLFSPIHLFQPNWQRAHLAVRCVDSISVSCGAPRSLVGLGNI